VRVRGDIGGRQSKREECQRGGMRERESKMRERESKRDECASKRRY